VDALPLVVVANAAAAIVLFAAAALATAVARSPAVAHKAWLLVLLKLITPPLVVLPVVWSTPAVESRPRSVPPDVAPTPGSAPADPSRLDSDDWPDFEVEPQPAAASGPLGRAGAVVADPDAEHSVDADRSPAEQPQSFPWRTVLAAVWLAGAAAYWLLVVARIVRFHRLLRLATPVPAEVAVSVRLTAARLGLRRVPAVQFVGAPVSPMVWAGFARPRLVLPRHLWDALPEDQREAVLAHELAHLKRGDHWVRRMELLAVGLYWWFPVAWLACRRLRDAEEACCDAWVMWALPGRAAAYAEALVETVAFVSRPGWVPLASGGAARADALKRRLTMIMSNPPARKAPRTVAFLFLAAGLLALPVRPGLADEPKQPVPDAPTKGDPSDVLVFRFSQDQPKQAGGEPPARGRVADPTRSTPPSGRAGAAAIAELKDELELLEAQAATKQAHVRAAEVAVKAAQRKLELLAPLQKTGQVAQGEVIAAQAELETSQAQLDVKKAELGEHMVRVKQAKRRLETASVGDAGDGRTKPANPYQRAYQERAEEWLRGLDAVEKEKKDQAIAERDQLRAQFEKLQKQSVDLAAQRNELARQLSQVTAQQEAIAADLQRLKKMMDGQMKIAPDRAGPTPKR
jgi:beta-lactamase regulating signal transducer with metallopeptidase domain